MKTAEESARLAKAMVEIGAACGRRVSALITNMDLPLGQAVGNALEVEEALAVLQGEGPEDLKEVCLALAAEMIALSHELPAEEARQKVEEALESGAAYEKMKEWIAAQGGDLAAFLEERKKRCGEYVVCAPADGFIASMDAQKIGISAMLLGAGRARKEDAIDPAAGLILLKKTGDKVQKNEPIAKLFSATVKDFGPAEQCYLEGLEFTDQKPALLPLILRKIGVEADG